MYSSNQCDLQEKYLSEHHYDEQVDEDAALRILNFGDDYRNYIDSLSDGLSSCDERKRPKKKFRKSKVIYLATSSSIRLP